MANNVNITAGSGTPIATDDVGGVHYQRVKITDGTEDSSTAVNIGGGVEANALRVTLANDSTGVVSVDDNSGSLTVDEAPVTGSGSLTGSAQSVALTLNGVLANATFQVTGTWTATLAFEASNDNSNWTSIYAMKAGDNLIVQSLTSSTDNDVYRCTVAGFNYVRLRCSAYTSGTAVVTAAAGSATSGVFLNFPIPAGTNNIGDVDVLTVPTDPFGANADAASATGSISAKLRFIAATGIPVTGTVTVDSELPTAAALADNAGNPTAPAVGAFLMGYDGTNWDRIRGDGGSLYIQDGGNSITVDNAGTFVVNPQGYFVTVSTDVTRPADTVAYAVNDALSDSTSAPTSGGFTFTSAARASGKSGIITDAIIVTSADAATLLQGEIFLFNTSVTNINDNTAFAISDAEAKTCIGKIPFTLEDIGNNGWFHAQNLNIGFTCSGSANLRFLIRVKNAYTPVSAEVFTFILKILQVD